jgi:hypothetical protein
MHASSQFGRVRRRCFSPPPPWKRAVPRRVMGIPLSNPYGMGSYRGGLQGLGQITAAAAAQTAMPTSQISSTAGFTQTVYNDILQAAQSGNFVGFNQSGCTGVSAGGNIKIIQSASGLALSGVSMGLTAAGVVASAALAPFTLGISAIIGLFPLFFAHHAAAVAKEQQTVCAAVPAAANYLQQIQAAVSSGASTPTQAIQALQSLLSDFTSQVSSIMKNSASSCNAACVWVKELTAIVAYQTSGYQDQINAAAANPASSVTSEITSLLPASVTSSVASVAASTGVPTWAVLVGIGLLAWTLL